MTFSTQLSSTYFARNQHPVIMPTPIRQVSHRPENHPTISRFIVFNQGHIFKNDSFLLLMFPVVCPFVILQLKSRNPLSISGTSQS